MTTHSMADLERRDEGYYTAMKYLQRNQRPQAERYFCEELTGGKRCDYWLAGFRDALHDYDNGLRWTPGGAPYRENPPPQYHGFSAERYSRLVVDEIMKLKGFDPENPAQLGWRDARSDAGRIIDWGQAYFTAAWEAGDAPKTTAHHLWITWIDHGVAENPCDTNPRGKTYGPEVCPECDPETDELCAVCESKAEQEQRAVRRGGSFRTVYLAVMPRTRKPKAVGAVEAGWYRQNARKFYEVAGPGMTAEKARQMIKAGQVQPTWIDGRQVDASGRATGRLTLHELFNEANMWLTKDTGNYAVLVFADGDASVVEGDVYIPIRAYSRRGTYAYDFHRTRNGITYDTEPLSLRDIERYKGRMAVLGLLREHYGSDEGFKVLGAGRRYTIVRELKIPSLTRQDIAGV